MEPWDEQKSTKYELHDLVLSDMKDIDFVMIKSAAIRALVDTKEDDQVRAIVSAFMGHLTSKGFRIVKKGLQ